MRQFSRWGLACLSVALFASPAAFSTPLAQSATQKVFELRALRDAITTGQAKPDATYQPLLETIARDFASRPPNYWSDPETAAALLAFITCGGDIRLLRNVMTQGSFAEPLQPLANGFIAYYGKSNVGIKSSLPDIDAKALPLYLAGPVALMQAIALGENDETSTLELLDTARLLAPGTFVEEAALRRAVALLGNKRHLPRLTATAWHYSRQYSRSPYAPHFYNAVTKALFTLSIATPPLTAEEARTVIRTLVGTYSNTVVLAVLRRLVLLGRLEQAQNLHSLLRTDLPSSQQDLTRADLYSLASSLSRAPPIEHYVALRRINRTLLDEPDQILLDATVEITRELSEIDNQAPSLVPLSSALETPEAPLLPIAIEARRRLTAVDALLKGSSK